MADTLKLIKNAVGAGMKGAGMTKAATLIRSTPGTRTVGALTAGTNPTTTNVPCLGLVRNTTRDEIAGTLIEKNDRIVMLFGKSLGDVVPTAKDRITIEGVSQVIIAVERDPAGAVFTCLCRG